MMFHRLKLINKNQLGLTMMELMLAFALTAAIIGAITATIHQVVTGNLRSSNHMTAVRQVQDAGYWVSHDVQMVQADPVIDNDPATPQFLTLTWSDWGTNKTHQAVYTLEDMSGSGLKKLLRTHSYNSTTETGIIAQFIDPDPGKTNCYLYTCLICDEKFASMAELEAHFASVHPSEVLGGNYESGKLTFTVTATVGTGSGQQIETRTYEVFRRASPQ